MEIQTYLAGVIFTRAYRIIRTHVTVCLEQYNLTLTSWSLLGTVLQARDGILLADVAEALGVKAPLVTRLSQSLMERQLVERIPHQTDKRAKVLVVTSLGERFIEKIDAQLRTELGYLLRGVAEADLEAYKRVLQQITTNGAPR